MTHAQRIMERAKFNALYSQDPLGEWDITKLQGLTPVGYYVEGRQYENARLLPIIQKLLLDNSRMAEALSCNNSVLMWDKRTAALTTHTQTLKELAGDV